MYWRRKATGRHPDSLGYFSGIAFCGCFGYFAHHPMKIDCYLSEHCGSYYQLRDNIGLALKELGSCADVVYHTISYDEAVRLGITGSPTIRLDGKDLFEGGGSPGIA